tara:strand:+ start:476 stop:682 length:207 start_codon:yes stop_codon:yes gene_type:complete
MLDNYGGDVLVLVFDNHETGGVDSVATTAATFRDQADGLELQGNSICCLSLGRSLILTGEQVRAGVYK